MLLAHHQPLVTRGKYSRAGFLVENAEQSHAETKGVFGCDFLPVELAEALNQFLLALVREGIPEPLGPLACGYGKRVSARP